MTMATLEQTDATPPLRTAPGMSYARARLWLGVTSVGAIVMASAAALTFDVPRRLFGGSGELWGEIVAIAGFLAAYIGLSAPFDLFGGYLLPKAFQRDRQSFAAFVVAWGRGVLVHSVFMFAVALLILWMGRSFGLLGASAVVLLLMLVVLAYQVELARLVCRLPVAAASSPGDSMPENPLVLRSRDEGFVGGFSGLPGRARLVVPEHWFTQLAPALLQVQLKRRRSAAATGARLRGVLLALGWNLLGFVLCANAPGSDVVSVAGIVNLSLWFTLWSFVGLLILPTPSRAGVFEVDRDVLRAGVAAEELQTLITALDRWQDDEPSRPRGVETIFHPVPSVTSRRAEERNSRRRWWSAWHAARMALPLSWPCLGLLPRAVHCNSGRPALWVMLPGD